MQKELVHNLKKVTNETSRVKSKLLKLMLSVCNSVFLTDSLEPQRNHLE